MGEASFCVYITKSKAHRIGYCVRPVFKINLKIDDRPILDQIEKTLECGRVREWGNAVTYEVSKLMDIVEIIIPFFEQYPLQNKKVSDLQLFKIICYKLVLGEGKTIEGIKRIISIREVMNNGGCASRKKIVV